MPVISMFYGIIVLMFYFYNEKHESTGRRKRERQLFP